MKKLLSIFLFSGMSLAAFAQSDYEKRIISLGYDPTVTTDWSDSTTIKFDEPVCAYVNITGIDKLSTSKTWIRKAWLEFYDGNGNYFRKRILESAQGNSSVNFYDKKNMKLDFCEDEWVGEETPDIFFGNWVPQDSYHLKAYHNDTFKGYANVVYKLYDQMVADRGPYEGKAWARAGVDTSEFDERALCHPDGFPTAVYLNGKFHGIWIWQLKKHRKNMNFKKNEPNNVHLDGQLAHETIFWGTINWYKWEVKNPKNLYAMNGKEYDEDVKGELMDETSAYYDLPGDTKKVRQYKQNTAQVKKNIIQLSKYHAELTNLGKTCDDATMREEVEKRFDVASLIDYYIFTLFTDNYDGIEGNWQWVTWDGYKWFVLPYDVDCVFGIENFARFIYPPEEDSYRGHFGFECALWWARKYFYQEVKDRYALMRKRRIFSKENILNLLDAWTRRIGEENYALEKVAWPNSPCLRQTIVNENWEPLETWTNYSKYPAYSADATYQAGDIVKWSYKLWKATGTTKGVVPAAQTGYTDTIERLSSWLDGRLVYADNKMGYVHQDIAGDINCDDEVNVVDVMLLVDNILNKARLYDVGLSDVNGDGDVNVTDVMAIVHLILH